METENKKITVVLIDDHKMVRQGIARLLELEPDIKVIGEAGDGMGGVNLVKELKPDVVITDLMMKGWNGLRVTEEVKRISPETRVAILSMHEDAGYVRQALKVGASGYVVKGSDIDDLATAIRQVKSGKQYISPSLHVNGQ